MKLQGDIRKAQTIPYRYGALRFPLSPLLLRVNWDRKITFSHFYAPNFYGYDVITDVTMGIVKIFNIAYDTRKTITFPMPLSSCLYLILFSR